jgi:hypothetical protein
VSGLRGHAHIVTSAAEGLGEPEVCALVDPAQRSDAGDLALVVPLPVEVRDPLDALRRLRDHGWQPAADTPTRVCRGYWVWAIEQV